MSTDNELTNNISKYLAQKIESEDKSTFRIIAELITLLSSAAALIGAGIALYTSYLSLGVQTKLDKNQIFLNENDMISSLWYQRCSLSYKDDKGLNGLACNPIPLSDKNSWGQYYNCLYKIPIPDSDIEFTNITNLDRVRCLIEDVGYCRVESTQNECPEIIHNKKRQSDA